MTKIQILFPDPDMARLKEAARQEDRAISEIVRRATEAWLARRPARFNGRAPTAMPVFHGGAIRVAAAGMRSSAWADRDDAFGATAKP